MALQHIRGEIGLNAVIGIRTGFDPLTGPRARFRTIQVCPKDLPAPPWQDAVAYRAWRRL
jgi:hypothetical protein